MREVEVACADVDRIVTNAAQRRGIDLRAYLPGPLHLGIATRARAIGCATAAEYANHVDGQPEELTRLLEAIVVPVSAWFRDPEVFMALEATVLPSIVRGMRCGDLIRAWVAAVATGEEAWSLGVVAARCCPKGPEFRIIGSDVAESCLAAARAGNYPASSVSGFWRTAAAEFLWEEGAFIVPGDLLRSRVTFARHDLLGPLPAPREAVLASFHIVMLRNVLIYIDRQARRRVLERVLSVLEPGGALVLGEVEMPFANLSRHVEHYPGVDPRLRIFRVGED